MFHTSPDLITEGTINKNGIASACLFFSDDIYKMSAASQYVYEADFNCCPVSDLYDDETISRIAEYFDCDADTAESLLDGSQNEWDLEGFECEAGDSWFLQSLRGECAVKMGFDGCKDHDEQGVAYIVPMLGREHELQLIEGF